MAQHMAPKKRRSSALPVVLAIVLLVAVGAGLWFLVGQRTLGVGANMPLQRESQNDGASFSKAETGGAGNSESAAASKQSASDGGVAPVSEFARMLRDGEIGSIRLIGDSITAGFGTNGYDQAVSTVDTDVIYDNGSERWYETPASVGCWANAFRDYARGKGVDSFVNAGINGAFMSRLADTPDAWLGPGADVVFVALGTNDAGYYGTEEFRITAQEALSAVEKKSKLVVVLAPVCDLRPAQQLVEPAAELGDVLESICEERGYLFVDPREALTSEMFNADGLHPNSQGSMAIWHCIQQTLGLKQ